MGVSGRRVDQELPTVPTAIIDDAIKYVDAQTPEGQERPPLTVERVLEAMRARSLPDYTPLPTTVEAPDAA